MAASYGCMTAIRPDCPSRDLTFDPPISLPYKGLYVLWLQDEDCNVLDYPILYHTGSDEYPIGGSSIRSGPMGGDCVHMQTSRARVPSM